LPRVSKKQLAQLTWEGLIKTFPDAACSLDVESPEKLAIRGILSAQCTDKRVNMVAGDMFTKYPDLKDIAELSEEEIGELIKTCGLWKSKAKSVKAFSEKYVNEWNRTVPDDVNELMKVPGVGKKIANLIIGEIYSVPAIVVDTHMKRTMHRIGLTNNTDPLKVEEDLNKVFPKDQWIKLGHLAVTLGRTYCVAQNPKCDQCPLNDFCRRRK